MVFQRTTSALVGALALAAATTSSTETGVDAVKLQSTMSTGMTHTIRLHRNHMTYKLRQQKAMQRLAARVGTAE